MLVIVPITRCGDFPEAAITSLRGLGSSIRVLASFNRAIDPDQDQQLLSLLEECKASVLHTPKRLSPAAHFHFIVSHARKKLNIHPSSACVVLCDDDQLLVDKADLIAITDSIQRRVAVWGPFRIIRPDQPQSSIHEAFFQSPGRTVHTRLQRLADEMAFAQQGYKAEPAIFASITGLFAPFEAFLNAARFFRLTFSHHGARAEVLLLSLRNLSVTRYGSPVAAIAFHPSQSGLEVRELGHLRSEIRFRAYALLNSSSPEEAWALMHLGFNPRWFWRAGVSTAIKASSGFLARIKQS